MEMETGMVEAQCDFFDFLAPDVIANILMCLDDPGDIVRASSVSRSWRYFILSNRTSKQLCQRLFPQLCSVSRTSKLGNNGVNDWSLAKMEHEIFASLTQYLISFETADGGCISYAIFASSTDRYPDESISNTLDPRLSIGGRASYWSSSGQKDPNVTEKLTYKLVSDFCVISQIDVQPFQAYFQRNYPIYSARAVRFRMGHQKLLPDNATNNDILDQDEMQCGDDKFVWTYTSPEFPMTQNGTLQAFRFPQPALCIGGILQIELLGRVQRQESDSQFYICVAYVQAVGYSLSPVFSTKFLEPYSGKFSLEYNPKAQFCDTKPIEVSEENSIAP